MDLLIVSNANGVSYVKLLLKLPYESSVSCMKSTFHVWKCNFINGIFVHFIYEIYFSHVKVKFHPWFKLFHLWSQSFIYKLFFIEENVQFEKLKIHNIRVTFHVWSTLFICEIPISYMQYFISYMNCLFHIWNLFFTCGGRISHLIYIMSIARQINCFFL